MTLEEEKREIKRWEEEPAEVTKRLYSVFLEFLDEVDSMVRNTAPLRFMSPYQISTSEGKDKEAPIPLRWRSLLPESRIPPCDCVDQGDRYVITMEVPGIDKDKVSIYVNRNGVEVKGEALAEEEEKGKYYVHKERKYRSFHRYLNLPEEVVPFKGEAKMVNGILEIVIPKKSPKPEEKPIKLELKSS
jgi:HSP20 family protein